MTPEQIFSILVSDVGALSISVSLLALYQFFLFIRLKRDPLYTVQAVNALARAIWVEQIIAKREVITGVQTLRNSTMAATFLASTAALLIVGVLTLSEQSDKLGSAWHVLNFGAIISPAMWMIKLLAILIDLFIAFFSFAMSIRTYNHVGFLLYVPAHTQHETITTEYVIQHLNRAGRFYSIGMRSYYYLVPLVFWLFGPIYMLAASIGLIISLFYLDRSSTSKPH